MCLDKSVDLNDFLGEIVQKLKYYQQKEFQHRNTKHDHKYTQFHIYTNIHTLFQYLSTQLILLLSLNYIYAFHTMDKSKSIRGINNNGAVGHQRY